MCYCSLKIMENIGLWFIPNMFKELTPQIDHSLNK